MDFHGAPLSRTWVKLGATAKEGDNAVTLAEPVTGWRVGDRIIVTATQHAHYRKNGDVHRGADHQGHRRHQAHARSAAGARAPGRRRLSRRGRQPEPQRHRRVGRPARACAATPCTTAARPASISYAEFRHLGKKGVLGRYSLHYHLVGDTMRGSSVVGASIWDSGNRWLTIHGTNYLVVRDCVGYQSIGHGFFLEDGTEVYNVLDRNLAVQALARPSGCPSRCCPSTHNDGAGFWWANSLNTFTRNVAAENDQLRLPLRGHADQRSQARPSRSSSPTARRKSVDIRTLPFVRFDDNEVHCDVGLYGVNLGEGVRPRRPGRPASVHRPQPEDLGRALRLPAAGAVAAGREPDASTARPTASITPTTTTTSTATCTSARRTPSRSTAATTTSASSTASLTVDGLTFDGHPLRQPDAADPDQRRQPDRHGRLALPQRQGGRLDATASAAAGRQPRRRPAADAEDGEGRADLPARLLRPGPARQGGQHQAPRSSRPTAASTAPSRR